jgi:hypothetical protein
VSLDAGIDDAAAKPGVSPGNQHTVRDSQLYISAIRRDYPHRGLEFTSARRRSGVEEISAWFGATPGRMISSAEPGLHCQQPPRNWQQQSAFAQQSGCTTFQGG